MHLVLLKTGTEDHYLEEVTDTGSRVAPIGVLVLGDEQRQDLPFWMQLGRSESWQSWANSELFKNPSLPFEFSGYCIPWGCVTVHSNTPLSTSVLGLSIGSCSSSVACGQVYKLCAEAYFIYVVSWNMLKLRRYLVSIFASLKTVCYNVTHILVFGFYRTSLKTSWAADLQ